MITILGAGGAIGNELVKLLAAKKQPFRLVGRNPKPTLGATEIVAADLLAHAFLASATLDLYRSADLRSAVRTLRS